MAHAETDGTPSDLDHELVAALKDFHDPRQEWRRLFSELLGTFFLVLVAAGGGMMGQAFPGPTASRAEIVQRSLEMLANTCPFDVTGHPAMSIPCGLSDGRPVGLMLIGKHCNESTIYRAAYAYEQSRDWMKITA
jgi:Asp-tRNA(Asn)/Glu-tRNA(Gln) amidotransferase A subunit family amidase